MDTHLPTIIVPSPDWRRSAPSTFALAVLLSTSLCPAQDIHVPAQYPTIQQAVNAANSGQRIVIAAGVHEEQIVIDGKNLSLSGEPGTVIQSPLALIPVPLGSQMLSPVLVVTDADTLGIDGIAFDGLRRGDALPRLTGVFYSGVGGRISNCSFTGFRSQNLAAQPGPERAIEMVNPVTSGQGQLRCDVLDCTFADNLDSIYLSGDPSVDPTAVQIRAHIVGNHITGVGPTPQKNQRGIFLDVGVTGEVRQNTITDHVYLGPASFSIAIEVGSASLVPVTPYARPIVWIRSNTLSNNNAGIAAFYADHSLVFGNTVTGGPFALAGIGLSGDGVFAFANSIVMTGSVVPGHSGFLLLGAEFNALFNTGFASDTRVFFNSITGATTAIAEQTGVTGTWALGNITFP